MASSAVSAGTWASHAGDSNPARSATAGGARFEAMSPCWWRPGQKGALSLLSVPGAFLETSGVCSSWEKVLCVMKDSHMYEWGFDGCKHARGRCT